MKYTREQIKQKLHFRGFEVKQIGKKFRVFEIEKPIFDIEGESFNIPKIKVHRFNCWDELESFTKDMLRKERIEDLHCENLGLEEEIKRNKEELQKLENEKTS